MLFEGATHLLSFEHLVLNQLLSVRVSWEARGGRLGWQNQSWRAGFFGRFRLFGQQPSNCPVEIIVSGTFQIRKIGWN